MDYKRVKEEDLFSGAEVLDDEIEYRDHLEQRQLNFGIGYLDDCLNGIACNDLILISAKTGAGKTQMVTHIALNSVKEKRSVYFFALEAERGEITRRMLYDKIAKAYYSDKALRRQCGDAHLNYADWFHNKFKKNLGELERKSIEELKEELSTLKVRYKVGSYNVSNLRSDIMLIQDKADLIVIDHLHYIDLDSDKENVAMTELLEQIRDISLAIEKPIVLVAHVRKEGAFQKRIMPTLDDVYGSSNISKIVTKSVMIAPALDISDSLGSGIYGTYIQVNKYRRDGSRVRYVGLLKYDTKRGSYDKEYVIGKLTWDKNTQKFEVCEKLPYWAEKKLTIQERMF